MELIDKLGDGRRLIACGCGDGQTPVWVMDGKPYGLIQDANTDHVLCGGTGLVILGLDGVVRPCGWDSEPQTITRPVGDASVGITAAVLGAAPPTDARIVSSSRRLNKAND